MCVCVGGVVVVGGGLSVIFFHFQIIAPTVSHQAADYCGLVHLSLLVFFDSSSLERL